MEPCSRAKEQNSPFPTNPRARHWKASLRDMRSLRIELMTSLRNSSFCTHSKYVDPDWSTSFRELHMPSATETHSSYLIQEDGTSHVANLLFCIPAKTKNASSNIFLQRRNADKSRAKQSLLCMREDDRQMQPPLLRC